MIDIKKLEKNENNFLSRYKENLQSRGEELGKLDSALQLNLDRKKLIALLEEKKAMQNKVSREVGQKKKSGENADAIVAEMQSLREQIKQDQEKLQGFETKLSELLLSLPNMSHKDVPLGSTEADNIIEKTVGKPSEFNFEVKDHVDLGEALGGYDFDRAAKVTGSRFTFLRNDLALLERALVNFMLDVHIEEHGYQEVMPPYLVNESSMTGTGQLPKFGEDSFLIEKHGFYLVPTAEVPVTNFFANEVLGPKDLPHRFVAFSPCFRSEAGSYGKDTRGLIRQHQFHKVELLIFCRPEESYDWHEKLTSHAENILTKLELPFRRALLCSGDISFSAAKCYDLEVWLPSQKKYREISSCSNFEDFQSRRANIRFKEPGGKPQFLHTLNGSGLAVGRTSLAILENFQNDDGTIRVPEVLVPYMRGKKLIKAMGC